MPLRTARKLRILQVLHSPGCGGAEIHALELMTEFQRRGHEVCYAGRADSWLGRECARFGIAVKDLRMRGMLDLASYIKLARFLREWRPDIVHAHLSRASRYASTAARLSGIKIPRLLTTVHTTAPGNHMRAFGRIVAVSGAVKNALVERDHPESSIHVIHHGIPDIFSTGEQRADLRLKSREALGIPPDQIALVCAGRFVHDKGQDLAIAAVKQCPPDVHLYLIGAHDTEYGRRLHAQNVSDSRIHFPGFRPDVPRLLPAFDCYVAPSRREALSLSLLEASAAGLPIVASNIGGIPEVVADGASGVLVPPDDAAGLARAICQLTENEWLAARYGQEGRRRFEARFTIDRMIDATLALYRGLPASAAGIERHAPELLNQPA